MRCRPNEVGRQWITSLQSLSGAVTDTLIVSTRLPELHYANAQNRQKRETSVVPPCQACSIENCVYICMYICRPELALISCISVTKYGFCSLKHSGQCFKALANITSNNAGLHTYYVHTYIHIMYIHIMYIHIMYIHIMYIHTYYVHTSERFEPTILYPWGECVATLPKYQKRLLYDNCCCSAFLLLQQIDQGP
jgi:hypothetical protein